PVSAMVPADAPQELVDMIKRQMGLDQPLPVQYWRWLRRVVQGDLGNSLATRRPVLGEIRGALSNTFVLAISAAIGGFSPGGGAGHHRGVLPGRWLDKAASATAISGVSLPHYWVGIVLIIIFSVEFNWLPAMGMQETQGETSLWSLLRHMILPTISLSLIPMGW
ncbi:MAG: ABC transporter permease, partial [Rhodobacteraceae bacterium]|nr:ABC transporter permease [Paracoccaceae bacterium]